MRDANWIPRIRVLLFALFIAAIGIFWSRSKPLISETEQIESAFNKAIISAENRDVDSAMTCVSSDFHAPGGLDFDSARMLLRFVLQRQYPAGINVRLVKNSMKIRLNERDKTADVIFQVRAQGKRDAQAEWEDIAVANDVSPELQFQARMVKKSGDWKVSQIAVVDR
jgi:hypothetical protein